MGSESGSHGSTETQLEEGSWAWLSSHTGPHSRTPGLPVEERRAGLHGVDTPEENDSLAESHGLSQDEYSEPRDHLAQTPCSLFSNLRLSRKLIEEHPHIELLNTGTRWLF